MKFSGYGQVVKICNLSQSCSSKKQSLRQRFLKTEYSSAPKKSIIRLSLFEQNADKDSAISYYMVERIGQDLAKKLNHSAKDSVHDEWLHNSGIHCSTSSPEELNLGHGQNAF